MQKIKLLVFDSHPVQYRVPIWQTIEQLAPGSIHVVYASDCSVKGHQDAGFGQQIKWDEPLLEGYASTILNCEVGIPLSGYGSLNGEGVEEVIDKLNPAFILLTGLNYKFDHIACKAARNRNIPVWLRCENQDEAMERSFLKSVVRSIIYRFNYSRIEHFFYIGELNKAHYLKHGVKQNQLSPALYGTIDRYKRLTIEKRKELAAKTRLSLGIEPNEIVVGFSGKFISKKNPDLLYQMLPFIPLPLRKNIVLYFVGSGEMESQLKAMATDALTSHGVKSIFPGFINQSKIGDAYLAMDIMVLPSRKMGETWGLVANEGLQAGCGVIVSDAVGSSANFADFERFEVIKVGDFEALAENVVKLAAFKRDFSWSLTKLEPYSIEAIAGAFTNKLGLNKD